MSPSRFVPVDAGDLLRRVAEKLPPNMIGSVVIIGSVATAWYFRSVTRTRSVMTKDIDVLLHPGVDAVFAGETIGQQLLNQGWLPQFPNGIAPGTAETPIDLLPALRLSPPGDQGSWYVELLAEPPGEQTERKQWQRMVTDAGDFGLPSFRFMGVAIYRAELTEYGVAVARPAYMALAHLLEHAIPDITTVSNLPGNPPRYLKDVGRALSLWWLTGEQSTARGQQEWAGLWRQLIAERFPGRERETLGMARDALLHLQGQLGVALPIANNGVLASHRVSPNQWENAWTAFGAFIDGLLTSET